MPWITLNKKGVCEHGAVKRLHRETTWEHFSPVSTETRAWSLHFALSQGAIPAILMTLFADTALLSI